MLPIKEILDADVVIVGGGVGGLMAAVSAARNGARTIVLEKANTKRSGSGAGGNDHFACYIPEVHGDLATARQATLESMVGPDQDRDVLDASLERSLEILEMWHSWGIDMKLGRNGGWLFEGHAFPGKPRVFLKYNGSNQKKVLTEQARKAGAVIVNHSPVLEMLPAPGGGIGGVLALDTTEERPAFRIVRARAVIMAAGNACRLFVSANTPGLMFNVGVCPANTGESIAQFWRIGGEQAAAYVKGRDLCGDIENTPWARERMAWYSRFGEREQGAAWQECNHAIQQILSDFAAPGPHKVRSASLLNSGLKFIGDLRVLIERQLAAPTAHELMRAAETLAIVDMGEIMIRCALERRESRGNMHRSDYTFTNPLLNNKFIRIVKENGEPRITWRDIHR